MGRVGGHRGRGGELTVRVWGGDAGLWTSAQRFWIGNPEDDRGRIYEVEQSRGYRDRLVLKLQGLDDASAAAQLRGCQVLAPRDQAPSLPDGVFLATELVGLEVLEESGRSLGRVVDVVPTGGADLLVVRTAVDPERPDDAERELLIPLAKEIVTEIAVDRGWIRVRPPAGLLELNQS